MAPRFDSLIFDMDGTLWDAVRSYCAVWDATARDFGLNRRVSYDELVPLMGQPIDVIYDRLMGDATADRAAFMESLGRNEAEMMPRLGGTLYPGVSDTLSQLHDRGIGLYMVSNCSASGLDNFLDFTGLRRFFTDALSFGATGLDKEMNMRALCERYNMVSAAYVGDVQSDADSAHAAGLPFIWAAYGFGSVIDADYRINHFNNLLELIWN